MVNKKCLFLLVTMLFLTNASGYIYRGAAMARGTLKGWIVTSDTCHVFYTPNCGLTWYDRSFLAPRFFLDIYALNENKLWIGAYEGTIYYSNNGGERWYRQAAGLSKWSARIFFLNETLGWAACGEAIVGKTTCGNETTYNFFNWEQISLPNPPYSADSCDIYGIHFIDENRGWFCAGRYPEYDPVAGETLYIKGQGYIAKTVDGGGNPNTWQLLRRDTIYDFFDIKFLDSLNGFVVGGNDRTNQAVILRTQNGGLTWQEVPIPSQAKYLRALDFVTNRHGWAVGRNGTILRTRNGGNTWEIQQSGVDTTLFDVSFADTLRGLIAGNGCVLYTNNGGATWHIALTGIKEADLYSQVSKFDLKLYPNPFTHKICFAISSHDKQISGKINLYDIAGNLVIQLPIIKNLVTWDGTDKLNNKVAPGIYFARLVTKDGIITKRIIYTR
ncbi:MAG: YCF48-related protein [candidate division WOR-3 bacterium]|nr:YCF48-related protein [candidate division WOR-3 bacterium]MDW7988437.1 YCF48-related protein [candidate division WOR-3 bacterium]